MLFWIRGSLSCLCSFNENPPDGMGKWTSLTDFCKWWYFRFAGLLYQKSCFEAKKINHVILKCFKIKHRLKKRHKICFFPVSSCNFHFFLFFTVMSLKAFYVTKVLFKFWLNIFKHVPSFKYSNVKLIRTLLNWGPKW